MGDMKTPDFDDLLAAFDIPDMVDPKAAIESGHTHHDEDPNAAVSVIVKNVRKHDSRPQEGGRHATGGPEGVRNRFSPISSADEADEDGRIEVDEPSDGQRGLPCLRRGSLEGPGSKGDVLRLQTPDLRKTRSNGKCGYQKMELFNTCGSPKPRKPENQPKVIAKSAGGKTAREQVLGTSVTNHLRARVKSTPKLSSCIAAIAALSTNKTHPGSPAATPLIAKQGSPREVKESPKEPQRLPEPELAKQSVSKRPRSLCGESGGEGSPSSPPGSTPAVPKVRIKTIKTSSGQIKRTVTRVPPEIGREGLKGGLDLASLAVSSLLSPPLSPSPSASTVSAGVAIEVTKQMTVKPVATAFLPASAVKTAGSQVINLKLSNNTTVKATVIPAASVQSASDAILKAASAIQRQTTVAPTSGLAASELRRVLSKRAVLAGQAPDKVSRVRVLSGSQGSVVEAFNRVLGGTNPVPVYVPDLRPPSLACISLPSRGYRCLECGDSFALEKSLTRHYGRRSVRIEVTCNRCAENLVFYNKCSLLAHARGHRDKGAVMQCSHLVLKPIPADQMISALSITPGAPVAASSGSPVVRENSGTTVFPAPQMALPGRDASEPRGNVECLECRETFPEESSLAAHYQRASDSTGHRTCPACQMMLPNPCSLASHQRLHRHRSPYICPECGAACLAAHLQSHVATDCLHYARRVGYRCVHCGVIFSDVSALKCHIQASHCEIFYKCPVCPMAFKSAPGTHAHASTQHPGSKIGEPKLIYKCSMCDTVFTQQILLYTHFDQHVSNQRVAVFKCPDCSVHYAQKHLMLDHIKSKHGTLRSIDGPPKPGVGLPLATKPIGSANPSNTPGPKDPAPATGPDRTRHRPSPPGALKKTTPPTPPGWTCEDCGRLFTQREIFIGHMKIEHGKQLKKHPCRQCEKSFSSSHSLCRHNRVKHKGVRKVYTCPNCPDSKRSFTKRVLLEKHLDLMHGVTDPERKAAPESKSTDEPGIKEQVRGVKRKLNSEGEDAEEEEDEDEEDGGGRGGRALPHPAKKLQVTVLKTHRCAVCGFTCAEAGPFQKHLPQHKSDGSSHQCAQCGLCYTSRHSLARHLFIVHRLREAPGVGGGTQDRSPDVPRTQCRVCGRAFDAEPALNTHMRTHGMAFIESKRLSAAEK